jgi:hypothetical protein
MWKKYEFEDFLFDGKTRELMRADEPVSLSPKAAVLLAVLLDTPGQALSKQERMRASGSPSPARVRRLECLASRRMTRMPVPISRRGLPVGAEDWKYRAGFPRTDEYGDHVKYPEGPWGGGREVLIDLASDPLSAEDLSAVNSTVTIKPRQRAATLAEEFGRRCCSFPVPPLSR